MPEALSPTEAAKLAAARCAAEHVKDGMRLGLGTGSTAALMVRCVAERVRREGLRITAVPTSARTASLAREAGIAVTGPGQAKWLDLTIDGADEVDPELNLVKGGGGALLQEKIVAAASERMIVIVDSSKQVERLGNFPLPVAVVPFGWQATRTLIEQTLPELDTEGKTARLRLDGDRPFVTDEGNYILDLHLHRIGNARQTSLMLNQIPGVVENGLFIGLCDSVVIGHADGQTELRDHNRGRIKGNRTAGAGTGERGAGRETQAGAGHGV